MTAGVVEFAGLAPASGQAVFAGLTAEAGLGGDIGGNPIQALNPAAYFKFNTGITVTGAGVSQWDDQSGNGRHLLQATDTQRPALQGDGSILFDGVDDYLKCNAFTLNQPETVYIRFLPVSWAHGDYVFDGNFINTVALYQNTIAHHYTQHAGAAGADGIALAGSYYSMCSLYSGASSVLNINGTETTGNPGAANAGGFTLGAHGNVNGGWSNIRVKEVAIFTGTHDAATRAKIISYLNTLP